MPTRRDFLKKLSIGAAGMAATAVPVAKSVAAKENKLVKLQCETCGDTLDITDESKTFSILTLECRGCGMKYLMDKGDDKKPEPSRACVIGTKTDALYSPYHQNTLSCLYFVPNLPPDRMEMR